MAGKQYDKKSRIDISPAQTVDKVPTTRGDFVIIGHDKKRYVVG